MFSTVGIDNGRVRYIVFCLNEVAEIGCFVLWMLVLTPSGEAFEYVPKSTSNGELERIDAGYKNVFSALRENYPLREVIKDD
jgi:hypothetical protein